MDNNEFVKNLFDKLTNDMCEKWNEIRDTLPKSQQKTALKDLDQKTVQFIKMAEFCRRFGISNTVLKNIYMQNGQIYLRGYAKVCDLLGIKLKDLIY